jgi:hypothetical protein
MSIRIHALDFDCHKLGAAIAAALGDTWRAEPGYERRREVDLLGPTGERIFVTVSGRIELRGTFTDAQHDQIRDKDRHHVITVAGDTPPERIAGHLRRRLLPEYQAVLAVATDRASGAAAEEVARLALAHKIADTLPGGQLMHGTRAVYTNGYGIAEVMGSDNVRLEITLSGPDAVALAEFLRGLAQGREET